MSEIERDFAGSADPRRQQQIHRYALACDLIAGMRVLEIGLDDGVGAALMAARAGSLEGVDVRAPNVAAATNRRLARTRFQVAPLHALPFENDRFDAVIGFNIDWSDDAAAVLAEIRRVLRPDGFAMLRTPSAQADSIGAEIRRAFRRRFALAQRIVAASYIGPASPTALPNAADYRGYTLSEDGVMPGVVRPNSPEDIIWIVGQTALPRAEAADSLFQDPGQDLWLHIDQAPALPNAQTAAAVAAGDMAVLTALVEQLAEGPVGGDAASLARAIGQANVRLAVQDLKLADRERLNAGLAAAEQEYRRLADQLRDSREETAAVRLLAAEQRTLADQLSERLSAATNEAEARRRIIDETLEQTQSLAVALDRARGDLESARAETQRQADEAARHGSEAQTANALARTLEAELAKARSEIGRAASQRHDLEEDLARTRSEFEAAAALAQSLQNDLDQARSETDAAAARAQSLQNDLHQARSEADAAAALAQSLQNDLHQARSEADAAAALAQSLQNDLHQARSETDAAAALAQSLQNDLDQARSEADAAAALAQSLRNDLDQARSLEVERAAELSQAQELVNGLQESLAAEQNQSRSFLSENKNLRDLTEAAEARLHDRGLEIDQLVGAVDRLEKEKVELQNTLQLQIERAHQDVQEATQRANREIDALRSSLQELEQTREALAADLSEATEREMAVRTAVLGAAGQAADLTLPQHDLIAGIERLKTNAGPVKSRTSPLATRRPEDNRFALALRDQIQAAAANDLQAFRSALSAAAVVRDVRRDVTGALDSCRGVTGAIPARSPALNEGPRRPISRKARLRALLKGGPTPQAAPPAPLDAVAALFDPAHYLESNGVKLAPGETPFDHYVRLGRRKGLSPHPLIDAEWIRGTWPDAGETSFDLFAYINDGHLHDRSPHPLFDADFYRRQNSDVAAAGVNPLAHYVLHGWREGRSPNQMFDNDWYLATHLDVLSAEINPLIHYVAHGSRELRRPHLLFDHGFYLDRYPDVATSGMDAYVHFIAYGRVEGRVPSQKILDMQPLERFFDGASISDLLLSGDQPERRLKPVGDEFWPPRALDGYWLPQRLRDFIIDRYGEDRLQLYVWLFSLVDRFAESTGSFDQSPECQRLVARASKLARTPVDGRPKASIIVPVYNNLLYTLTCVVSVLESAPSHSFEILIGDDGSTDATAGAIKAIGGLVKHVRHPANLGFLGNCNAVARRASGEHLVFLNNDTIVFPGWLDALVETLDRSPEIGFVGSKLLNGDGTLQEAGGVFWRDGSAWNFGRNADPEAPEYNYLKDVDYVSGASIAVPSYVWRRLDGFDTLYEPAYCEDSDLAFRVRQSGYRTVYHPHSVLVHHEGRSHGKDLTSGVKAYQVVNQQKFFERWKDTLQEENFDNADRVFLARDRSRSKPHILIVDHYVPQWDRDAGSRTIYLYIKLFLDRGFSVTFWPDNLREDPDYTPTLQAMGVEVIYGPSYAGRFDDWFDENGIYFDYVLLSRPHIATRYIDKVKETGRAKIIYYGHDLHFRRIKAASALTGDRALLAEAAHWEALETSICRQSDVVFYPGQEEVDEVRARVPGSVSVINFPITIFDPDEEAEGRAAIRNDDGTDLFALMFVGGFSHQPNVGGVIWFVREVMPRLKALDTRYHFAIAGSNAPQEILDLQGEGVSVLGRISDQELASLYRTSALAIVPLLYGGGVKGKVIEAMARGVPVVMTSVGAQGVPDANSIAYVEDDPLKTAEAIHRATVNRAEALEKADRALDFIGRHYSIRAVRSLLAAEIAELAEDAAIDGNSR